MNFLTPLQLLVWYAGLAFIVLGIAAIISTIVIERYFRLKEQHISRIALAIGKTAEKMGKNTTPEILEQLINKYKDPNKE